MNKLLKGLLQSVKSLYTGLMGTRQVEDYSVVEIRAGRMYIQDNRYSAETEFSLRMLDINLFDLLMVRVVGSVVRVYLLGMRTTPTTKNYLELTCSNREQAELLKDKLFKWQIPAEELDSSAVVHAFYS